MHIKPQKDEQNHTIQANYLNEGAHSKQRKDAVSQRHEDRISNRHKAVDKGQLGVGIERLVHELAAVPYADRKRIIGVLRFVGL